MTDHSFDVELACSVGVNAAIIYKNICFWVEKNEANSRHYIDGKTWTYNSIKAFRKLFPYMGVKAIRNAIKKLCDGGYISSGEFNSHVYDRTTWYCVGTRANNQLPKGQIEVTERANEVSQKGKPIPDSKPYNKPDKIIHTCDKPDSFNEFFKAYPPGKKGGRDTSAWAKAKKLKLTDSDFSLMIIDIAARKDVMPSWYGQFAPGICKYLDEHIWKTPITPEHSNETSGYSGRSEIDRVNDAISKRARAREEALQSSGRTINEDGSLVAAF